MNAVTKSDLFAQAHGNGKGIASQATHIEQSRAVAQVQAALVVAKSMPRDEIAAGNRMREACENQELAEHAFFRYSRGGGQITGPSIHLAVELARCWGNIEYGVAELRRDDGESEMLGYAWDQETNTKVQTTFIVPHKRDTQRGPKDLTDMRDIYENNANNAARRVRECIFRVLPKSFVEEAKTLCAQTLEHGGGVPIEKRRVQLLQAFTDLGVSRKRLEAKIGRSADKLTGYDIGVLRVVYQSIRRGETTLADEFPDDSAGEAMQELKARTAQKPAKEQQEPTRHDPETGEVEDDGTGIEAQNAEDTEDPGQEAPPPAEPPAESASAPTEPAATHAAGASEEPSFLDDVDREVEREELAALSNKDFCIRVDKAFEKCTEAQELSDVWDKYEPLMKARTPAVQERLKNAWSGYLGQVGV